MIGRRRVGRLLQLAGGAVAMLSLVGGAIGGPRPATDAAPAGALEQINHVVVIYQENWSFDGLYGKFPGAHGLADAGAAVRQVDREGRPYAALPQPIDTYQ